MKRTTIMLPIELRERAAQHIRTRGISFGELVRESLAAYLTQDRKGAGPREDLLFADKEFYSGPAPKDTASRHDEYLYDDKS